MTLKIRFGFTIMQNSFNKFVCRQKEEIIGALRCANKYINKDLIEVNASTNILCLCHTVILS